MWSPEVKSLARLIVVGVASLALAGCFRPVYGGGGAPAVTSKSASLDVETAMKSVDVKSIDGRVGGKMRNELIFLLRGGAGPEPVAYRVTVKLAQYGQSAVVDPLSSVPESRTVTLTADYTMTRAGALDAVATGHAVATATYFSGLQRFANIRAERDAEDRAATQIAERIRSRLQAYFSTGK
jgi:LPS-assembly lipoprotein